VSKYYYALQRKFDIENKLELMRNKRMKKTYRGNETGTYKRFKMLENKLEYFEGVNMRSLYYSLMRLKAMRKNS